MAATYWYIINHFFHMKIAVLKYPIASPILRHAPFEIEFVWKWPPKNFHGISFHREHVVLNNVMDIGFPLFI